MTESTNPSSANEDATQSRPTDQRSFKNIFVSPGVQLRSAFYVGAAAGACSCALAFGFLMVTLSLLSEPGLFLNAERGVAVFEKIRAWGFGFIALTGLVASTAFWVGLRQSHRIAGPLYRLDQYLGLLLAGNYGDRVSLRESDEFREIADKINTLADRLEGYSDPATSLDVTKV